MNKEQTTLHPLHLWLNTVPSSTSLEASFLQCFPLFTNSKENLFLCILNKQAKCQADAAYQSALPQVDSANCTKYVGDGSGDSVLNMQTFSLVISAK